MGRRLDREELIRLVKILMTGEGTEEEQEELLLIVEQNVPDPNVSNLIYWPHKYGLERDASAEEIVEAAFNYEPIVLGPPPATKSATNNEGRQG